jgi:cytochrome c-type biogenesis protein CcmH/NrfG
VPTNSPRGLPPRIYLPVAGVIAIAFLALMLYLVAIGFGVTGSVFGKSAPPGSAAMQAPAQSGNTSVAGGPPPAVMMALKSLRARIAAHPTDDVAITQLGDMYLAANRFAQAIPLYERALKINPRNVAARAGLEQAQAALRDSQE